MPKEKRNRKKGQIVPWIGKMTATAEQTKNKKGEGETAMVVKEQTGKVEKPKKVMAEIK